MTLPNFIGIGTMRGGTTWLYEILKSHPDIYMNPNIKETHFFDNNYERGIEWYSEFFKDAKPNQIPGEITPSYLVMNETPLIINEYLPDVKLILMIRNPTHRAISNFKYAYKKGITTNKSFKQFLEDYPHILEYGLYYKHIQRWLRYFPREQLLIIDLNEVIENQEKVLKRLSGFLNVKPNLFVIPTNNINSSKTPQHKTIHKLGSKTLKVLRNHNQNALATKLKYIYKEQDNTKQENLIITKEDIKNLDDYYKEDQYKLKCFMTY